MKRLDVTVILDKSGSMGSIAGATIEGLNRFIDEQEALPGEAVWTLVQFDDPASAKGAGEQFPQVTFEAKRKPKIETGDYRPRGGTALLDACCLTIDRLGTRLANTPVKARPDGVLVVIVTDGEENQSKEFDKDDLNRRISHQQSKYDWKFLFLGANIDAIKIGHDYGITSECSFNYEASKEGAAELYKSVNRSVSSWRKGAELEMKADK